jgi:hypothetical protein
MEVEWPIWKCPCIKLFITYFRHLEKRHPYWPEMKPGPIWASIWKWSCSNPITGYFHAVWKYGQFTSGHIGHTYEIRQVSSKKSRRLSYQIRHVSSKKSRRLSYQIRHVSSKIVVVCPIKFVVYPPKKARIPVHDEFYGKTTTFFYLSVLACFNKFYACLYMYIYVIIGFKSFM